MLVFIRHAESTMNVLEKCIDDRGAPLTENGKKQARLFFQKRDFLKDFVFNNTVICSPAARCIETAEILGLKNYKISETLLEESKYEWLKHGEKETFLEYNWDVYKSRLQDFSERNASIVAHGGVINFLIFKYLGVQNYPGYEFLIQNCTATVIEKKSIQFI